MTGKIFKKEELNNLSFEDSLKQLEKIVEELDSGSMDLEKAVEAYLRKKITFLHLNM